MFILILAMSLPPVFFIVPLALFCFVKKFRYSLIPVNIGLKAAPLGCVTTILLVGAAPFLPGYVLNDLFLLCWFLASVGIGLAIVCKMTIFFFNKAKAWQESHPDEYKQSAPEYQTKPRYGVGIFLYIFCGFVTIPLASFIFRVFVVSFLCVQCHLNYSTPVKIPLRNLPGMINSISLTEYPIGFIPGNESAFTLIVDGQKGTTKRFPKFLVNTGSHYAVSIDHIPGEKKADHGWLQFTSGELVSYLHLDSLQVTDELPDELQNAPRQFIGIYKRGTLDTKAKDPGIKR